MKKYVMGGIIVALIGGSGIVGFYTPAPDRSDRVRAATMGFTAEKPRQTDGKLELSITEGAGGQPTPARVELLDQDGKAHIACDALLVGPGYSDRVIPWEGDIERAKSYLSREIENPFTRTTQFYSDGSSTIVLPAGSYRLRIYKGIEFKLGIREFEI